MSNVEALDYQLAALRTEFIQPSFTQILLVINRQYILYTQIYRTAHSKYSGPKLRWRPSGGFDHVTQSHKEIGEAKQMRETS